MSIKVLVVDDHQLFLDGIAFILKGDGFTVECVSTAEAAKELLQAINDFDLALIDIDLSGSDGLQILHYIKEERLLVPVVAISANTQPMVISHCITSGVSGYIPKSLSGEAMIEAIHQVIAGVTFIPEDLKHAVNLYEQKIEELSKSEGVGPRQIEVLKYMAQGLSNSDIGEKLFISESTVKSHISVLFKALGAKNRVACLEKARAQGLLT